MTIYSLILFIQILQNWWAGLESTAGRICSLCCTCLVLTVFSLLIQPGHFDQLT